MSFSSPQGYDAVRYTSLQVQTSTGTACVPLVWGANRVAPNLIGYTDFSSTPNKTKGKGGGKEATSYNYKATLILALGQGPIHGMGLVWKNNSNVVNFNTIGFSLFLGTTPQAAWSYMTANHPAEAMGYNGIAYVAKAKVALGQSPSLPATTFEVQGLRYGSQVGGDGNDADCALIIQDFLGDSNPWGVGMPNSILGNLLSTTAATTTGDSAYQTYCRAMGFGFSPALVDQEVALTTVDRWTQLTNTAFFWSGYALKFVPYGDTAVTANGVTYTPPITPVYDLSDNDYVLIDGQDPIQITRSDPADAYNSVRIEINDRSNSYTSTPITLQDQDLIEKFGVRQDSSFTAKEVCSKTMAALMLQLRLQRKAYIRNTYEFELPWNFFLLEPMDVVTLTDITLGLNLFSVRITEIEEDDNGVFKITAEEFVAGVASAQGFTPQSSSAPGVPNSATPPGPVNPPIIFEPPSVLTNGVAEAWMAVSGGDGTTYNQYWGGCQVWISTDGSSYNQLGEITAPAIQGKLTASLPAYGGANPDNTNTLAVSTLMSNGELIGGTAYDAASGMLLSYVDGELVSFENATLTGTDTYNLTTNYRGLYGTAPSAHTSGTQFARMDSAIFKYQIPAAYIGQTLYFKFPSFNIWGDQLQDLSVCTAYTFTPVGTGFGSGSGGVPSTPTGLSGSATPGRNLLTWNANPVSDNVSLYSIWRAVGASQPFGSAVQIDTSRGTTYSDTTGTDGQAYTYFIEAINAIGASLPSTSINLTFTAAPLPAQPFGFAFQRDISAITISKPVAFFDTPVAWTVPTSLTNSQGGIGDSGTSSATAPTAQTDFDIQSPPGTSIGTMRFAASSLTPTFIKASSTSIPVGQTLEIVAPANLNGMAGTLFGSIKGTR